MSTAGRPLAEFWLRALFWFVGKAPSVPRLLRPVVIFVSWHTSKPMRLATLANAARLLGPRSSRKERGRLARRVVGNFFDAVVEFGAKPRPGVDEPEVTGREHYEAARRLGRGAILATAHLGSFEAAIGLVTARERRVHVVFQRDRIALFERLRKERHARMGVVEAPVDDGLRAWFALRDALNSDEVVLMQADRVMEGQPGVRAPFLGGHVMLPAGPVKLARVTGSPIVPVFAPRGADGRTRVVMEEPILVGEAPAPGTIDPAQLRLAGAVERAVRAYPDQWLCLHAAWCEDAG
jgi:KDO2-lipid IV(A) lauroyltransferase